MSCLPSVSTPSVGDLVEMQVVNSWRNCQWEQPRTSEQRPEKEPLIVYTLDAANVHLHVHEIARAIINATPAVTTPMRGDRNLLFGAPGRSGRGPLRDLGGSQGDRPTPASRVLSYRVPGWVEYPAHRTWLSRGKCREPDRLRGISSTRRHRPRPPTAPEPGSTD